MLLTAAIAFLTGSLVGLRFNVRGAAIAAVAAVLFFAVEALFGCASVGFAALSAVVAVIMLQVGYFSSLALVAMGCAPAVVPRRSGAKSAAASGKPRING